MPPRPISPRVCLAPVSSAPILHAHFPLYCRSYIIAGDFNFGTHAVENDSLEAYQWEDVWATKKPSEVHGGDTAWRHGMGACHSTGGIIWRMA